MKSLVIAMLLLSGCADEVIDDGFGEACESISGSLYTTCESTTGIEGICAIGVCRRFCTADGVCPEGQRAIPTVANLCWCEP